MITFEVLHDLLFYDEDDGCLYWRVRDRKYFKSDKSHKSWNNKWAGCEAGSRYKPKSGLTEYIRVKILGKSLLAHTIIWWMKYGYKPEMLDHDDRNGLNNLLSNLSLSNHSHNGKNRPKRPENKTGVTGVSRASRGDKYVVTICGKHIGTFENFEKAVQVRKELEPKFKFNPNHGK